MQLIVELRFSESESETATPVWKLIAKLSCTKRAQRSTMGKKIGKLSIQENLVMT